MSEADRNAQIQNEIQTPCYIIHREELNRGIEELKQALAQYWPRAVVGYSFKTNALPWAMLQMKQAGFYAEVVSEDEYDLAAKLGFEHVIYNGPVKGKRSFDDALRRGYIVNLDARRELDWLEEYAGTDIAVGLRVNFDVESECPGETSGGQEGSRFGFSYETGEFAEALDRLNRMNIRLAGLHMHCGSKTRSINIYRALARKVCELKKEFDLNSDYIDLGGGYFGGMPNKPGFADYVKAIREELSPTYSPEDTTLIMEPGTSIITPPIEYVVSVVDVKRTYAGQFAVTDGSRIDVDPLHRKSSYFYEVQPERASSLGQSPAVSSEQGQTASQEQERKTIAKQTVCGFTCMEDDRLFDMIDQPELRVGDRIAFKKSGGYTMCLTPLFIRYFPRVYVEEAGTYRIVRDAWGPDEYMSGSHLM